MPADRELIVVHRRCACGWSERNIYRLVVDRETSLRSCWRVGRSLESDVSYGSVMRPNHVRTETKQEGHTSLNRDRLHLQRLVSRNHAVSLLHDIVGTQTAG